MRCAANEMWVKVGLRNPNRFAVKRHAETAHECNSALRKLLDSQEREILSITNLILFGFGQFLLLKLSVNLSFACGSYTPSK